MDDKPSDYQDLSRIESFSDNVFAFAATLLALSFNVPAGLSPERLPAVVSTQFPQLITYITSFVVIGSFWYSHHQKFAIIKRYDQLFIWLNLGVLMSLCLLPFTTNLVGDYSSSVFALNIYSLNVIITSLFFVLMWWYATYNNRLIYKNSDPLIIRLGYYTSAGIGLIFILSILLTFVHIDVARFAWILIVIIPIITELMPRTSSKIRNVRGTSSI